MIVETLANWRKLFTGPAWTKAFLALEKLTVDEPLGETLIDGTDILMRVMSFTTHPREEAGLETHKKYIDIQMTLAGADQLDWWPAAELMRKAPYDEQRDVMFYLPPAGPAPASIVMKPGLFCVLLPEDAHMPILALADGPQPLKKVVVKVAVHLVEDPFTWR